MLTGARETLLSLIETYPETPAAQDARRMLGLEVAPTIQPIPYDGGLVPSYTAPVEPISVEPLPQIEPPTLEEPRESPFNSR